MQTSKMVEPKATLFYTNTLWPVRLLSLNLKKFRFLFLLHNFTLNSWWCGLFLFSFQHSLPGWWWGAYCAHLLSWSLCSIRPDVCKSLLILLMPLLSPTQCFTLLWELYKRLVTRDVLPINVYSEKWNFWFKVLQ